MFTKEDIKQIESRGLTQSLVAKQISRFNQGFPSLNILKAATVNDGIIALNDKETTQLAEYYEENSKNLTKVKFVPSSGAASRMFKYLFGVLKSCETSEKDYLKILQNQGCESFNYFYQNLKRFAFFDDLNDLLASQNSGYNDIYNRKYITNFLKTLLTADGLNYANLPKGLLKFHKQDFRSRTPVEEHLVEGVCYAKNDNIVNLHFTVSENHLGLFKAHLEKVVSLYEKKFRVKYNINLSIQKSNTDTVAVDVNNNPFRDNKGNIVFRPGGHGSLLQNLNETNADLIFVKNIDNVVQDRLKKDTILYKKALAGMLIKLRKDIYDWILKLNKQNASHYIYDVMHFVSNSLNIKLPPDFENRSKIYKIEFLLKILNRPIRICGMVRNQGEPGGGPFWVENNDNSVSLQILESAQIDDSKKNLMKSATHFNSVDLVCSINDYTGKKFDLNKYTDPDTGFINKKSLHGRELKALELPGLWNGAMANWNTVFVEVPLSTFAPVKKISDLLQDEHLSDRDLQLIKNYNIDTVNIK